MADVNTGTSSVLRVTGAIYDSDAPGIWSDVSWALYLIEVVSAPSTYASGVSADVTFGPGSLWAGTFTFDWRPSGLQSVLIASGIDRVYHNADGTPPAGFRVYGSIGSTGTSGGGGPTAVEQPVSLTTLKVVPGTPTDVAAVRDSDSQVSVSWAQSSASNGQPTSNTIRRRINGGGWADAVTISPSTSSALSAGVNQKLEYGVKAANSAGSTAWSTSSNPVYTTPAAPSAVSAAKSGTDIVVGWANNVGFSEYETEIWHGTMVGSTITWDGSALSTAVSGATSYTHVAPDNAQVHVYRVRSRNLDTGALSSAYVQSNSVQLLAAPNAPTFGTVPSFANKAADLVIPWAHNPVDTTAQTAYEFGYSTDGGSTWAGTGKVTSGTSSYTIPASTYAANVAVTVRVRTWGQATTGGSDTTGASPYSTTDVVTFKTLPVATITTPADTVTFTQATLTVVLGFSQAESASFVRATIGLYQGTTLLEQVVSTTAGGTTLATKVADGVSYTVKATVLDSNGLNSSQVSSAFTVAYTLPVAAVVTVTYLEDSGIAQLDLAIASPGAGEAAAVTVTIMRTIDGKTETVIEDYPTATELTILDMTPTIHGTNEYTATTFSADGAAVDVAGTLVTAEESWAFLSTGAGFSRIVSFSANLTLGAVPDRVSVLIPTSGRDAPIVLFGENTTLVVDGSATIFWDGGSTVEEIETFLLEAGRVCYRDPSGRRMFGVVKGAFSDRGPRVTGFAYTVSEAS